MSDLPNPADFSVNEREGEYEALIDVRVELRIPIKAESLEEAQRLAEVEVDQLWEAEGEEIYPDSINEVRLNRVWKTAPMYRVTRDGRTMQVSRLLPGDVPRQPDDRDF